MNYLISEGLFGKGCRYVCDVCLNFALKKLQAGNIVDESSVLDESVSMNESDHEIMDISSIHDDLLDEAPPSDEVDENEDTRTAIIEAVDFLANQIGERVFRATKF